MPKLAANVRRDREADLSLKSAGWTVVRAWEHEINNDIEAVASRIVEVVASSLASRQRPDDSVGSARSLAATRGES
jgi:very-short-patch-repair endonuclease